MVLYSKLYMQKRTREYIDRLTVDIARENMLQETYFETEAQECQKKQDSKLCLAIVVYEGATSDPRPNVPVLKLETLPIRLIFKFFSPFAYPKLLKDKVRSINYNPFAVVVYKGIKKSSFMVSVATERLFCTLGEELKPVKQLSEIPYDTIANYCFYVYKQNVEAARRFKATFSNVVYPKMLVDKQKLIEDKSIETASSCYEDDSLAYSDSESSCSFDSFYSYGSFEKMFLEEDEEYIPVLEYDEESEENSFLEEVAFL